MKFKLFNKEGMTRYSAGISLALHILFLLSASSLFMPKYLPTPPKSIKIKFIAPKPQPPPEIKKVEVKVEPQMLTKPVIRKVAEVPVQNPVPKAPEPRPVQASARQPINVMTTARMTVPDTLPTARSFPVSETAFSPRSEGKGVTMVTSQIRKASLPSENPRPAPEIADTTPAPDPQILKGYLGIIQRKIERAKEYPDIARRAGSQGRVKVQFTILKDGRIENAILIDKTQHRVLNEEALAAISRAAPFDRLPDEIGKDTLSVILPFSFLLN